MRVNHLAVILSCVLLASCSSRPQFVLMETPAIYHRAAIDPFAHLQDDEKDTNMSVFYATNRELTVFTEGDLPYGNQKDDRLHFGKAVLRFGDENFQWSDLYSASISPQRDQPVSLSLERFMETGTLPEQHQFMMGDKLSEELQQFVGDINAQLDLVRDKEIMLYVHGTKVDFLNSIAMTAEIDHFTGRDFVGIAFAWPSHQNILYYLFGMDVTRAKDSSQALRTLIEFLARYTKAERINILAYSAGGRVLSKALYELRNAHPELTQESLHQNFRLGAVIFAAADVPLSVFHERLPAISDLAGQIVVTVSDHDPALEAAEKFMGGGIRISEQQAEEEELGLIAAMGIKNFEVIDLSLNSEGRGFDIVGHHYWYRHPWASSDIVLLLRTNLPPHRRGLNPAEMEGVFYMSPNYPKEAIEATKRELGKSWLRNAATR